MNLRWLSQKLRRNHCSAVAFARIPKQVTAVLAFQSGTSYPICPWCDCTLDREYMRYCDRCGQRLSWERYDTAAVIYAPRRKEYE